MEFYTQQEVNTAMDLSPLESSDIWGQINN